MASCFSKLFSCFVTMLALLAADCILLPINASAANSPLLLRKPTISQTQIAFSYGGDLWVVDRKGGEARHLTSDVGIETDPIFSPDGSLIAFTGEYDGNEDVYVIPASGGIPKRLTTHPARDQVVGWTRDGKRILFRSQRNSWSRFNRLFTVNVDGGLPEEVPLPMAEEGSYSPDSSHLAYVPFTNFKEAWESQRGLKHYRGGTASPIWIAKLSDSSSEKLPRKDSNDSSPMWFGERIYFLSDRNGPVNLFWYDTNSKQVAEAFSSDGMDIKSASMGPDAIVYEKFGSIHVFDPAAATEHQVDIRIAGDFPAVRPHFVKAAEQIQNANVSPTGARAVFEAHGEIFTVPAEHGDIRNLTNSSGVADRDPAWSPDGKWIAYFSDLRAWMEGNRLRVDALSKGKLAYVYLPDTFVDGYTNFNRYYFAQSDRQGAVIDERYNGGGWLADYIVDWLKRPLLAAAMTREGKDNYIPQAIFGPKVMLINEYAGSGGDALPWMFKRLGTGPLIGTRTWGGLIGIGGYPNLMDGGSVTAPRWGIYNPESGEFDVENKGVPPDIEVELDPAAWRQGRDPQLEKAIAVALDNLQQHPTNEIKRPKYPVYNWSTMRTGSSSTQKPGGQQ